MKKTDRTANLKPFVKGQSGNPKGRPKMPDIRDAMTALLADEKNGKTALDSILTRLKQMALDGNLKAAEMLLNRAYGQPKQQIDHTTAGESIKPPASIVFTNGDNG